MQGATLSHNAANPKPLAPRQKRGYFIHMAFAPTLAGLLLRLIRP